MAFRTAEEFKEQKYNGKFVLQNDGDYADVILLYRSTKDVLLADAHYIKSATESTYCHCLGTNCPACRKGLRVQTKLFIPMLVLSINGQPVNKILFWDRNASFEPHLNNGVFKNVANPSEYVFRITRSGAFNSRDVRYNFALQANNKSPYDEILKTFKIQLPDYYETVIKEVDDAVMTSWLNSVGDSNNNGGELPDYVPMPRTSISSSNDAASLANDLVADPPAEDFELGAEADF